MTKQDNKPQEIDNQYKQNWAYPNPKTTDPAERRWQRFWEMVPGILTWSTFIGMFVFSRIIPTWVAIFIIAFDTYWILRTVYIASYTVLAYRKMRRWEKINWLKRLQELFQKPNLPQEITKEIKQLKQQWREEKGKLNKTEQEKLKFKIWERKDFLKQVKKIWPQRKLFLPWEKVYHVIMLPTAVETAENIRPALRAVLESNYPREKIIILLAMEEREDKKKRELKEKTLRQEFGDKFFAFISTVHKVQKGEMKCKASNTTYAAKKMKEFLEKKGIPLENVILSNLDCETRIHPQYLAALTFAYVTDPKRLRRAYQPLPMYNNNIWETIAPVRIIVTGSSFWHMIKAMRPEDMVTFSSHSEPFKTIVDIGYWPVNVISEDSLVFWNAYTYFDGDYRVKPIYLPVSMDAVLGHNYWHTLKNQYKQKHRWAYGIENLPLLFRAFRHNKKIPFFTKVHHLGKMLIGHYSWATTSFVLALLGWLPLIFGGEAFKESVLAHNLPFITRYLMTIATAGLFVSVFLSLLLLPPKPKHYRRRKYLVMVFQWVLAPFIAPFLSSIPAIHAQTRLLLGKYMGEFWVTEKPIKKIPKDKDCRK